MSYKQSLLTKRKNRRSALDALQTQYEEKKQQHDALISQLAAFVPVLGTSSLEEIKRLEEDLTSNRFALLRERLAQSQAELVRIILALL